MKRLSILFLLLCAWGLSGAASAQERNVFLRKGDRSFGAQFATLDLDSDNIEYMLVFNPITAKGRISTLAPFIEYAYRNDRTAGVRIGYTSGNAAVDNITLDLLNEGMVFDMSGVNAGLKTLDAAVFHRNYFALDRSSRVALVTEVALSASRGSTEFTSEDAGLTRANSFNTKLSFSPGVVFFIMNNISVTGTVSMAHIAYNRVDCYSGNEQTGSRTKFGTKIGLDLLGLRLETAFHF